MMIEKWDSMNKSNNNNELLWMNHDIFSEIFALQNTDQTRTKNKLIIYSNAHLGENNDLMV